MSKAASLRCVYTYGFIWAWWRHQMETFSTVLVLCAGNSPVIGEFSSQRPVTRSFGVFFYLRLMNCWANNGWAGDFRRHRPHYDVTVMVRRALSLCGDEPAIITFIVSMWYRAKWYDSYDTIVIILSSWRIMMTWRLASAYWNTFANVVSFAWSTSKQLARPYIYTSPDLWSSLYHQDLGSRF